MLSSLTYCATCRRSVQRDERGKCPRCGHRSRREERKAKAESWRTRRHPIARTTRPRNRMPNALGDHRERVKAASKLWTLLIYGKEPSGICPVCRKRQWTDSMHGWAKGPYPALRFELDNGAPGCRSCHRRLDSDHHAKREFWLRYIGSERYARLELMANARCKVDVALVILDLRQRIAAKLGVSA